MGGNLFWRGGVEGYPMGTHATNYQSGSIISIDLIFFFFSNFRFFLFFYFWPQVKKNLWGWGGDVREWTIKICPKYLNIYPLK